MGGSGWSGRSCCGSGWRRRSLSVLLFFLFRLLVRASVCEVMAREVERRAGETLSVVGSSECSPTYIAGRCDGGMRRWRRDDSVSGSDARRVELKDSAVSVRPTTHVNRPRQPGGGGV